MLKIESVSKTFGKKSVLHNVSLQVGAREVLVILGPSACGKTTLLRIIAGLEEMDEGKISLFGRDLTPVLPKDRKIAMVFQTPALNPHLSCFENIEYPLVIRKEEKSARMAKVQRRAAELGLSEGLLKRSPKGLSGGEAQRVALARALVREPECFLLDEPLSALDPNMRATARQLIWETHRGLAQQTNAMMLFVTHDQDDAIALGDRIAIMKEGHIEQVGTAEEIFERPVSRFVAEFFGKPPMNFLSAEIEHDGNGRLVARFSGYDSAFEVNGKTLSAGDMTVSAGIRPTDIRSWFNVNEDTPATMPLKEAIVRRVEGLGDEVFAYCETDLGQLRVKVDKRARPDSQIFLGLEPACIHWFDETTGCRLN